MNVYCSVCGSEMEIMTDLISELRVYPCGCGGSGEQESQSTQRAADECPTCAGLGFVNDDRGRRGVDCSDCNGSGIRR